MIGRIPAVLCIVLIQSLAGEIAHTAEPERWPAILTQLRDAQRLHAKADREKAPRAVIYLRGGQTVRGIVTEVSAQVVALDPDQGSNALWIGLDQIAALGVEVLDPEDLALFEVAPADQTLKEIGADLARVLARRGVRVAFEVEKLSTDAQRSGAASVMSEAAAAFSAVAESALGKSALAKVRRVSIGGGAAKVSLSGDRLDLKIGEDGRAPSAAEIQKALERSL